MKLLTAMLIEILNEYQIDEHGVVHKPNGSLEPNAPNEKQRKEKQNDKQNQLQDKRNLPIADECFSDATIGSNREEIK